MGTSLETWQSTSLGYRYVLAIEGFEYLVTNASPAAAVAAWAGTDWTQALGGLFVDLQREGSWDPFAAFPGGGRLKVSVTPDPADVLGSQIGRTSAGAQTQLVATIDANDTTLTVKSTDGFASSGDVYVGTERIGYAAKTSTTLTGLTRGKYSPFPTSSGGGFGHQHRSGLQGAYNTALQPIVSEHRRSWRGALVGLWVCRERAGVLDTRAEAQLVFAGVLDDIYDDGETGHTVIQVLDVLDTIKGATLVRDPFRARIADGVYIPAGTTFEFVELKLSSNEADPLTCVAGPPADSSEFTEGQYTVEELASVITAWLAGQQGLNNIDGSYTLRSPHAIAGQLRTVMEWHEAGATSPTEWVLTLPSQIAVMFGVIDKAINSQPVPWESTGQGIVAPLPWITKSLHAPMRWVIPNVIVLDDNYAVGLTDVQGTFWGQYSLLPDRLEPELVPIKPPDDLGLEWGIFTLGGTPFVVGAIVETGGEHTLQHVRRFGPDDNELSVRYQANVDPPNVELVQIYAVRAPIRDLLLRMFASTGAAAHNHATYDAFPLTLSLGLPWGLLGDAFEASVLEMPEGDRDTTLIVDKPISIDKLLNTGLILRGVHLVWKDQGLRFRQWQTPVANLAVAALVEGNKAMPAGNRGTTRTTTRISTRWLTPIVSIMFDRHWIEDRYRDGPLVLEDRVSVDDMGGHVSGKEIKARNETKADIEAIAPLFLERMQFVSRPAYIYTRPIDQRLYETLSPGDIVTITDSFSRDPVTGARGMSARPGLVTSVRYSPGGPEASNPTGAPVSQVGVADVLIFPFERPVAYAPAGQLDQDADSDGFTSGYNSSTNTIRLIEHEFTHASGFVDASFFTAGDAIEVTQADPPDPANPQSWDVTVVSRAGNDLLIDTALAGFDPNLVYRIRSQPYADAQAAQLADAYQADDADGKIADTAEPYSYALPAAGPSTAEAAPWPAELLPELAYGDGVAMDAGTDRTLCRTLNALMDHRTAHQSAALETTVRANTTLGRAILCIRPLHFGAMRSTGFGFGRRRFVSVAPWLRSSTGASITVTVTLCRDYPVVSSLVDQVLDGPTSSASWTTTSTTWATGDAEDLDLAVLGEDGVGYLVIEATQHGETRGLALCRETEVES